MSEKHLFLRKLCPWWSALFLLPAITGYGQRAPAGQKPKILGTVSLAITTTNPTCATRIQPTSTSFLGNGSITVVASGGTPPYKYYLGRAVGPQNNGYFPGLDQGNYLVEAIDAQGAYDSVMVYLSYTLPQPGLQVNVLQIPTSCTNTDGAIQLAPYGGTPPYTYSWDGGVTFQPAPTEMTNLQQGYYWIFYAKDANGCIALGTTSDGRTTANYFMCWQCCALDISGVIDTIACTNNGQITVSVPNSEPPIYYSLDGVNYQLANSSNQNVNIYTHLTPGIYNIYVKNSAGLIGQATFMMPKACVTDLGFQTGAPSCNKSDGSITVIPNFGTAPYTYSMDGINYQSSNVFPGLPAGNYGISVKDGTGAVESGSAALTVLSTENCLQVTAAAVDGSCGNDNGSVTVDVASGTAPFQYSIDGVNFKAANVFTGLAAGTYTLTARDAAGLSGTVQATVGNMAGPQISAVSAPAFCSNASGTLTITATGGGPLQYSVDNGASFQAGDVLNVNVAGQYQVVVKDVNGCTTTTTQLVTTLPAPVVSLGDDTALCTGDSLELSAPVSATDQYLWQDNSTGNDYLVKQPGIYSVQVTNSSGCTAGDTIVIGGKPLPVFSLGNDTVLCAGQPLTLSPRASGGSGAPGGSYLWNTGSSAALLTVTQPGLYWLRVTAQGCLFSDSVVIDYKPVPAINLGADTTLCEGQVLLLDVATPNASYAWQDGTVAPEYKVESAGVYSVKVTLEGCDTTGSKTVSYIGKPVLNMVQDTTLCVTRQLTLNAFFPQSTYLWQDGSVGPQYSVTGEGVYTVQVTNTCGTTGDTSIVKYENCNCVFYIPDGFTPNGDGHNDVFRPKYTCLYATYDLKVFNRWGQLLFESENPDIGWDGNRMGRPQPIGTYVWMMKYQDQLTGKVVEQKGTVVLIR